MVEPFEYPHNYTHQGIGPTNIYFGLVYKPASISREEKITNPLDSITLLEQEYVFFGNLADFELVGKDGKTTGADLLWVLGFHFLFVRPIGKIEDYDTSLKGEEINIDYLLFLEGF